MNITIFKTWHMESNTYSYWKDGLPSHDKYTLIIGQATIPECIQNRYLGSPIQNQLCYEDVITYYKEKRGL